ncbi:hypothetical protein [Spirosoma montaniterrae]|uniref:Uncharacterized protein n=1 Tax=Spirosoma montaniterrae TaxID=1178516 RepID=A0A1P9X2R5_9BACT|nr:hypothetical protein [Spirosoma montaniterrae]AQG81924.1 hypothetical protein AWR27_23080 [Spirosoma montaniterrae]
MQRRVNPWVVALTAALTFGSLLAFVGPRSFDHRWGGRYGYERQHGLGRGHCDGNWRDAAPAKPESNSITQ